MEEPRLGAVESRFADIIWQHEPLPSGELVQLCQQELSWKKSTTYTVLRKLCERGLFCNTDGVVTSLMTRTQFDSLQSERFVQDNYGGSLPAFIAAFAASRPLSTDDISQIRAMIDGYGKEQ